MAPWDYFSNYNSHPIPIYWPTLTIHISIFLYFDHRAELARRRRMLYRVARVVGTLVMVTITLLLIIVPSTKKINYLKSPKIAPYRHGQHTHVQEMAAASAAAAAASAATTAASQQQQQHVKIDASVDRASARVLYQTPPSSTVPITDEQGSSTTSPVFSYSTTPEQLQCCIPTCDLVARKTGMCTCYLYWSINF